MTAGLGRLPLVCGTWRPAGWIWESSSKYPVSISHPRGQLRQSLTFCDVDAWRAKPALFQNQSTFLTSNVVPPAHKLVAHRLLAVWIDFVFMDMSTSCSCSLVATLAFSGVVSCFLRKNALPYFVLWLPTHGSVCGIDLKDVLCRQCLDPVLGKQMLVMWALTLVETLYPNRECLRSRWASM